MLMMPILFFLPDGSSARRPPRGGNLLFVMMRILLSLPGGRSSPLPRRVRSCRPPSDGANLILAMMHILFSLQGCSSRLRNGGEGSLMPMMRILSSLQK